MEQRSNLLGAPCVSWAALGLPKADMELPASVAVAVGIAWDGERRGFVCDSSWSLCRTLFLWEDEKAVLIKVLLIFKNF